VKKKVTNSNRSLGGYLYWGIIKFSRSNKLAWILIDYSALIFYKVFRGNSTFKFLGKKYKYFYHTYNRTMASERVVEVPIGWGYVKKFKGKQILEVGHVLGHYFPVKHDILDKYENGDGVINEDVIDYSPNKKYDLILSISTMEHVGWTYGEKKESKKFMQGIDNLRKLLKKDGTMIITFAVHYRDDLTKLIRDHKMPFNKEYFMKRTSFLGDWVEIDYDEAMKEVKYDSHFANANIVYIGVLDKS